MRKRDYHGAQVDAIDLEARAANREGREVQLTDAQLASLGHRKRNPLKVIRSFCLQCMGGAAVEVKRCTSPGCALYVYRLGRDPYSRRTGDPNFGKRSTARARISEQRADFSPETDQGTEAA